MAGRFGVGIGVATAAAATILLAQPAAATDNDRRLIDGCETGGGGADIAALESSHDARTDRLTVTLRLCEDAAPDATWRLHLDHAAPFLAQAGAASGCATPADTVISRGPGGHRGAGRSRVVGNRVIFTVPLVELGVGAPAELPQIPLWATSSRAGTVDRAPNRETGDGCQHPRSLTETLVQTRIVIGNLVWISKLPVEGFIDGVSDAWNACSNEAHGAGRTGLYIAWFSDNGRSPSEFVATNRSLVSTGDGTVVAQNLADMSVCNKGASGTDCLRAPINRDIHGYPVPTGTLTWTGTQPNGTAAGAPNCNGWTSFSAADTGNGGSVDQVGAGWAIGSTGACNQIRRLICVQID